MNGTKRFNIFPPSLKGKKKAVKLSLELVGETAAIMFGGFPSQVLKYPPGAVFCQFVI